MNVAVELWIVLVATLLSGYFSGVETAIISARAISVEHRARAGQRFARLAQSLLQRREAAIVTAVLGNNLVLVAGSAAATALAVTLLGERGEWIAAVGMATVTVLLGEVLPKALLRAQPERGLILAAPLFYLLEAILWPLRWLVLGTARLVLGLLGLHARAGVEQISRDVVRSNLERSLHHGGEELLLKRFLDNIARPIRGMMTSLEDAACLGPDATVATAIERVRDSHHSRLPILDAEGRLDGLVLFRDLLDADPASLAREYSREILQLPDSMSLDEAIVALTGRNASLAGVLDAGERPVGILALEDLLATLLGDFKPEAGLQEALQRGEL